MKNIMEEVRKFLRTYPPLAEGKLHVDFLPEEAQSYSVEAVPAKEIVRSYVDGSTVRQFLFVVASREFFGDKIRQQLDNLSFYGDFSEWLREQTMAGNLPNLGEGRKVMLMDLIDQRLSGVMLGRTPCHHLADILIMRIRSGIDNAVRRHSCGVYHVGSTACRHRHIGLTFPFHILRQKALCRLILAQTIPPQDFRCADIDLIV